MQSNPTPLSERGWAIWLPQEGRWFSNGASQHPIVFKMEPARTANRVPVEVAYLLSPIAPEKTPKNSHRK